MWPRTQKILRDPVVLLTRLQLEGVLSMLYIHGVQHGRGRCTKIQIIFHILNHRFGLGSRFIPLDCNCVKNSIGVESEHVLK